MILITGNFRQKINIWIGNQLGKTIGIVKASDCLC